MTAGKVRHWKHGWIPLSAAAKRYVEGKGPKPGGAVINGAPEQSNSNPPVRMRKESETAREYIAGRGGPTQVGLDYEAKKRARNSVLLSQLEKGELTGSKKLDAVAKVYGIHSGEFTRAKKEWEAKTPRWKRMI